MKAICTSPDGPRLREWVAPPCPPGWVRLRVALAGVCRTDVAAATGALPVAPGRILGHEVAAWTPDGGLVSVRPRLSDGRFLGLDVDGAFAGEMTVPRAALVPLPADMDLRRAAFVEPAAAALSVLQAVPAVGGRVALRGEGRIAELCRRMLEAAGHALVDEEAGDLDVLVLTGVDGAQRLEALRIGGLVVLKGRPVGPVLVDQRDVVGRQLTLRGVDYGDFEEAAQLLATGALSVDDLFATPVPLECFEEAFEAVERRKMFLDPRA